MTEITINPYRKKYGQNDNQHRRTREAMQEALRNQINSETFEHIDVYNMEEENVSTYSSGIEGKRLIVFHNARYTGDTDKVDLTEPVNGISARLKLSEGEHLRTINAPNGDPVAQFNTEHEELAILFDLFHTYSEEAVQLFDHIIQEVERLVFRPRKMRLSWLHSEEKEALTERMRSAMQTRARHQLDDDKARHTAIEEKVQVYKRKLHDDHLNLIQLRKSIELGEQEIENAGGKLEGELDLVASIPQIKDIHIIDETIKLFTNDIYAYSSDDKRFHIGELQIDVTMNRTEVRFTNQTNSRRSWWGMGCPHPHVSKRGEACLGNVDATIAELCARQEIYALALTIIDFLENANVEDPAGRCVYNWDQVDEEGNVIHKGYYDKHHEELLDLIDDNGIHPDNAVTCECCDETVHVETTTIAYDSVNDEDVPQGEHYICEICQDERYTYNERAGAHIYND